MELNQILQYLSNSFAPYNATDTLSKVSALRLLPENSERTITLDILIHVLACSESTSDNRISLKRLNEIANSETLTDSIVKSSEDPTTNLLCEEVAFYGKTFKVFPGNFPYNVFNFENVLKAIFLSNSSNIDPTLKRRFYNFANFVLTINNEILNNLGIKRCIAPKYNSKLFIPQANILNKYSSELIIHSGKFMEIAESCNLGIKDIDWLITQQNSLSLNSFQIDAHPLSIKPIVKINESYIITDLSALLISYRKKLIDNFREENQLGNFAKLFRGAIWDSMVRYLGYLDIRKASNSKVVSYDNLPSYSDIFSLDSDKVMVAMLFSDDFEGYEQDVEFSIKNIEELKQEIKTISDRIYSLAKPPNEIFFLIIFASLDRPLFFHLDEFPYESEALFLSGEALKYISLIEGGKQLFFYKYAKSQHRKKSIVRTFESLCEYGFFKGNKYSYYTSDDERPTFISLIDDFSSSVKKEACDLVDLHPVYNPIRNTIVEVIRLHSKSLPLYCSFLTNDIQVLLEDFEFPIWFYSDKKSSEGELRSLTIELIDTLAFWLTQTKEIMNIYFDFLKEKIGFCQIKIEVIDLDSWNLFDKTVKNVNEDECLSILFIKPNELQIKFFSVLSFFLDSENNEGERIILRSLFRTFIEIQEFYKIRDSPLRLSNLNQLLDKYIPLGKRKKLFQINSQNVPEIITFDTCSTRYIDPIDVDLLLDEIGDHVSKNKLEVGISTKLQSKFINQNIVSYLLLKLNNEIRKLNGSQWLLVVLQQNESLLRERKLSDIYLPITLAFNHNNDEVKETNERLKKNNVASLCSRFLIEYLVCYYPKGLQPFSYSEYDKILSIIEQIINWGFTSDILYNEIANLNLQILKSNRIGVDREEYEHAYSRFLDQVNILNVEFTQNIFSSYWQFPEYKKFRCEDELNAALQNQFGYSLNDYFNLIKELQEIVISRRKSILKIKKSQLLEILSVKKQIKTECITALFKELTLVSRENLFEYPGYKDLKFHMFYPWRFNKPFSYIRRPLIQISEESEEYILFGLRHLRLSLHNFVAMIFNGSIVDCMTTLELKKVISKIVKPKGKEFNDEITNYFKSLKNMLVMQNVRKIGHLSLEDNDKNELGDIDVFIINKSKKEVYVIECKDFSIAKTPYELHLEITKIFKDKGYLEKHERRVMWVKNNLDTILPIYNVKNTNRWKINSILVSDEPLFSAYIQKNTNTRIMSFVELKCQYKK